MRPQRVKACLVQLLLNEGQLTELELAHKANASAEATRYSMAQLWEVRMLTKAKQANAKGRMVTHYGLTRKGIEEALKAETNLTLTGEKNEPRKNYRPDKKLCR